MDEKELEKLYNALSARYDIGNYNSFKGRMATTEMRKRFFDVVAQKGVDLGDYTAYEQRLAGTQPPPPTSQAPAYNTQELLGLAKERAQTDKKIKEAETATPAAVGMGSMVPMTASVSMGASEADKKRVKDIDARIKQAGFDPKEVTQEFADLPYVQWFDIGKALIEKKENPLSFQRTKAAIKWQVPLANAIRTKAGENAETIVQDVLSKQASGSREEMRANMRNAISAVRQYVDDEGEQQKLINEIVKDKAFGYGFVDDNTHDSFASDPRNERLNHYQLNALNFYEDTDPEKHQQYNDFLAVQPGGNTTAQRGWEIKARELERVGMELERRSLEERLTSLVNKKQKQGLSEPEVKQYVGLYDQYETLQKDIEQQGGRYPNIAAMDADTLAQEAIGQRNGAFKKFILGVGEEVDDTVNWLGDLVQSPFLSKESKRFDDLEDLGDKKQTKSMMRYTTAKNQLVNPDYIPSFTRDLQAKIDKVKADDNLTADEKINRTRELIMENPSQVSFVANDKGGKFNPTASAWANTVSEVGSTVFAQAAMAYVTGGTGNLSKLKQARQLFATTFATTYNDYYTEAIEKGIKNPSTYATVHTAIEASTELINNDLAMVKKLVNPRSTFGKIVGSISPEQWNEIARSSKGTFRNIGKALVNTGKEAGKNSFKEVFEELTGQAAGNIADNKFFGEETALSEGMKQTFVNTLLGTLPLSLIGLPAQFSKLNRSQKYALYEAGQHSEKFLAQLEQDDKNGVFDFDKKKVERIRAIIEKAAEVYGKGGKNKAADNLSDNEKADQFAKEVFQVEEKEEESKPITEKPEEKPTTVFELNPAKNEPATTPARSEENLTAANETAAGATGDGMQTGDSRSRETVGGEEVVAEKLNKPEDVSSKGEGDVKLTKSAEDLLASVREGSMPTFITKNLEKIAAENGIEITGKMTAVDVINALKEKKSQPNKEQTVQESDTTKAAQSDAADQQKENNGKSTTTTNDRNNSGDLGGSKQATAKSETENATGLPTEKEGFTEVADLNRMYANAKAKYGEKKGAAIYEAANRLVNPNKNTIIEIKSNGVTVKEGDKYIFKPFGNTDANSKKWTLYKGLDVTDQYKPKTETTQPVNKTEVKDKVKSPFVEGSKSDKRFQDVVGKFHNDNPANPTLQRVLDYFNENEGGITRFDKDWFNKLDKHFKGINNPEVTNVLDAIREIIHSTSGKLSEAQAMLDKAVPHSKEWKDALNVAYKGGVLHDVRALNETLGKKFLEGVSKLAGHTKELQADYDDYKLYERKGYLKDISKSPTQEVKDNTVQPTTEPNVQGSDTTKPDSEVQPNQGQGEPPAGEVQGGGEEEMMRLAHADTEQIYEEAGLPLRMETPTKHRDQLEREADEILAKGYDFNKVAEETMSGTRKWEDTDQVLFARKVADLKAKQKNLDINDPEFDQLQTQIEKLSRASDVAGTIGGRFLESRKAYRPVEESISDFIIIEKETLGVDELTPSQKENLKKEYDDLAKAKSDFEAHMAKREAEIAAREAEAAFNQTKTARKTNKKHEDFVAERKTLKEELAAARKEHEEWLKSQGIQKAGFGSLTGKEAKIIARIVKSYADEGVTTLKEVVGKVLEEVRLVIPNIEEADIRDVIRGAYNEPKKTRNQLAAQLKQLKEEQALLDKLQKLEQGIDDKASEKSKIQTNQRIKELRDKIKNHDLTKLSQAKAKISANIEKIEEQIKKGDYDEPVKKPAIPLDEEGHKLRDRYMKLRQQRDARVLLNQRLSETGQQRGMRLFTEILGIPRTLMTIGDFSALLRQNIFFTAGHPQMTARALPGMFKTFTSQTAYDRWFADLKEDPRYQVMKDSRLSIADSLSHDLTEREEAFMSTLAEKLPVVGNMKIKGVPVGLNIVKGSERSYTMLLNKMRVDVFNALVDQMEARGVTYENSPRQYKALAEYVNNATGRSDFGKTLNRIAPVLNNTFFSPRLIASRVNMLTYWAQPRFWKTLPREARIDYFRNWISLLGTGALILAIAKMGGADVEDDPRSSDFGKIRSGNTRWDIWGGAQPYVRVLAQVVKGERKSTRSGQIYELSGDDIFGETRAGVVSDFFRNKLAPVPGAAVDILSGRTSSGDKIVYQWGGEKGKEISISEYVRQRVLPMTITGTQEALKDQGIKALLTVGVTSSFGVGTQTFDSGAGAKAPNKKPKKPVKKTPRKPSSS